MILIEKSKIGISVYEDSIELVELSYISGKPFIKNYGKISLEKEIIKKDLVLDSKKFKEKLVYLLNNGEKGKFSKTDFYLAISENNIYSHLFELSSVESVASEDFSNKISRVFPLDNSEYYFRKDILQGVESHNESILCFVSALEKKFVKEWKKVFNYCGIDRYFFVQKELALGLSVNDREKFLLIDISHREFNIAIFLAKQLVYSYKFSYSDEYNKNREDLKPLSFEDKKNYLNQLSREIVPEIEKSLAYIEKITGNIVEDIFITGELSDFKDIDKSIADELDLKNIKISFLKDYFDKDKKIDPEFYYAYSLALSDIYFKENYNFKKSIFKTKFSSNFLKFIKIKYIFILAIFFLLPFVFGHFDKDEKEQPNFSLVPVPESKFKQETYFDILLSTDTLTRKDTINGTILDIEIKEPVDMETLNKEIYSLLEEKVPNTHFYWEYPVVGRLGEDESIIFPFLQKYFIFPRESLDNLVDDFIGEKLSTMDDYEIVYNKNEKLTPAIFPGLYKTQLGVSISYGSFLEEGYFDIIQYEKVLIVNTSGNKINIRKGPGVEYEIVAQASEFESYDYIRELDSWISIRLVNGEIAWVSSKFAQKIN